MNEHDTKELLKGIVDLMCAVSVYRLQGAGWSEQECLQVGRQISDELKEAIPEILHDELPQAAAGLDSCGNLTQEKLSIALTALSANKAVEIADGFVRQRVCQSN
jgi:hypothetical protein